MEPQFLVSVLLVYQARQLELVAILHFQSVAKLCLLTWLSKAIITIFSYDFVKIQMIGGNVFRSQSLTAKIKLDCENKT